MKLNPEKDLDIDVTDLTSEFKKMSLLLFRYYEKKADAEREYDKLKQTNEEIRARVYRDLRTSGEKHTEKSLEAAIDCNDDVLKIHDMMLDAKRDLATWVGAVESLKAKRDMLIQLGADARKE
jgi:hypothetical protein